MEKKQTYRYLHIIYIKTKDVYVDITKDNEAKFVTSNYELERPLPGEKISHQIND